MSWRDDLNRLRARMTNGYDVRMAQMAERRGLLEKFATELGIDNLLSQMNTILLNGGAQLIVNRSWQYDFEDDDDYDADEEDLSDEIIYTLYWHDGSAVEIEVRVGIDDEESGYVLVEDEEVADSGEAIQTALIAAFQEIADIPS
jgi:hypothetical protein